MSIIIVVFIMRGRSLVNFSISSLVLCGSNLWEKIESCVVGLTNEVYVCFDGGLI